MKKWRLIIDEPLKGSINMARDEALLDSFLTKNIPPTLRIYNWNPQCVSLGYFQDVKSEINLEKVRELNIDIVRRPTGGRGVLHTDEITYCLVIGEDYPGLSKNVTRSYKYLVQGIKIGLEHLGFIPELQAISKTSSKNNKPGGRNSSPVCFDTPSWYELLLEGKKVVGSAQMRKKGAILQHGSIKLKFDPALVADVFKVKLKQKKLLNRAAVGILDVNPNVNETECVDAIIKGFESAFEIDFQESDFLGYELARAKKLLDTKYNLEEYNLNKKKKEAYKNGTL